MPEARVKITAKNRTKKAFSAVRKSLARLRTSVFSTRVGVAALAGVAGFGLLIRRSLKSADSLAKMSDKLGIATEKLAGLHHAASLTGVAQNAVNKAIQNMVRTIRDANNGLITYKRSYDELGLDIKKLEKLAPDQQFIKIAEAIKNVESNTRRVGIAYDIFGAKGTGLLNTLALGKEGLEAAQIEAEKYGIALNRVDLAKIEAANDSFTRVQATVTGVFNRIAVHLAPIMEFLAKKISGAAKSSNGFKTQILDAMESATRGVAALADILRGLKVVFKGVELIGVSFGSAMISIFDGVLIVVRKVFNSIISGTNKVIAALNKLPKVNIALIESMNKGNFGSFISEAAEDSRRKVVALGKELNDLVMQEMPSDGIIKTFDEIRNAATMTAEKVAASRIRSPQVDSGEQPVVDDVATEKLKAGLAVRLAALDSSLLTEEERLFNSYANRQFMIDDALERGLISEQGAQDRLEAITAQHQDRMLKIKQKSLTRGDKFQQLSDFGKLKSVLGTGAKITSGMASQNRKMFEINKAMALASAVVSLPAAVMKSFENGGGYPWGLIPAGLMLAQGLSQISAIKSASFGGGGGGGGSLSGGSGTVPSRIGTGIDAVVGTIPLGDSKPVTNINLNVSGVFSPDSVVELIEKIDEQIGDGVNLTATAVIS